MQNSPVTLGGGLSARLAYVFFALALAVYAQQVPQIGTVAGNGIADFSGDGGSALAASLNTPTRLAVDLNGNLYIADSLNHRIRKVSLATGVITRVAGNGAPGFSGDGGPAVS